MEVRNFRILLPSKDETMFRYCIILHIFNKCLVFAGTEGVFLIILIIFFVCVEIWIVNV